ncbi:MAG: LysR family transcriptional regulator [Crocinitomicaceae bacterium]|nr:LysR family transcriptional regulator [Crocinitomicaceae bacterium]
MIDNYYNITPQQINYILELNNERNFQRASEKCFVTQPTLSMQIKKVEDLLGFVIFERSRIPLEPTREGEQLIEILKDVQVEYSRISTLVQKLNGNHTELIRMAIIPTVSAYLISDIFETVQQQMPFLQLSIHELKSEELLEAMEDNQYDIGIMAGPQTSRRMRTIPLFQEEIKIYYPNAAHPVIAPEELEEEQPWLLSKGNCLRTQMVNFCKLEKDELENKWNYSGGNMDILTKMVDLNGGYTLVPEYYQLNTPYLKRIYDPVTKEYPARQIIGIVPTKLSKKESVDALLRIIQGHYNTQRKDHFRVLDWK